MRILFLSAEVAPLAKVGGLADVAGSLPLALKRRGHDVRVAMPGYQMVVDSLGLKPLTSVEVEVGPEWCETARIYETKLKGEVPVVLINSDRHFLRTTSSASVYLPGHEQYVFFASALEPCFNDMGWVPDVVHLNDWHMGIAAPILRERGLWPDAGMVFTIHNLAYQGEFGTEVLEEAGLPISLFRFDSLEAYGRVNFLKAGCVFADRVNTVSPSYAEEIQTPRFGCRLDGLMMDLARRDKLSGIVNGIDTETFDPESDSRLAAKFSVNNMEGKTECRQWLARELGLQMNDGDLVAGAVTRLSEQKGIDLIIEIAPALVSEGIRLVVQGLGDPHLAKSLSDLHASYPQHIAFIEKFDEGIAQKIYSGCDAFLMPSNFEPCGLGQLIAMRYGTLPIVRRTGGLRDTVADEQNGFAYDEASPGELLSTILRAKSVFNQPARWNEMVLRAMARDSGWDLSAAEYEKLYTAAAQERLPVGSTLQTL